MSVLNLDASRVLSVVLTTEARGVLLLAAALIAAAALRAGPAAARHRVLLLAMFCLFLLPVAGLVAPRWRVPAPRWASATLASEAASVETIAPRAATAPEAVPSISPAAPVAQAQAVPTEHSLAPRASDLSRTTSDAIGPREGTRPAQRGGSIAGLLLAVWGLGTVLLLASLRASIASLATFARTSAPFPPGRVTTLAEQMRRALGIRAKVSILQGEEGVMPMSWGVTRPVILLPADAERWHRTRLVSVLVHELAHVRRADCATQIAAEAILALHWPNPLAWVAARRLRLEREHACDDAVVAAGARPSQYAEELLSLAGLQRPVAGNARAAVAMARPTHLTTRLRALLEDRAVRVLSRRAASVIALAASVVLLGVAGVDAVPTSQSSARETAPARGVIAVAGRAPAAQSAERAQRSELEAAQPIPSVPPSPAAEQLAETPPVPAEAVPAVIHEQHHRQLIPPGITAFVSRFLPVRPLRAPTASSQQLSCGMSNDGWRNTRIDSDDFDHRLTWSRPGCEVDVRIEGNVEFTADFRDVARLAAGAFLRIEEQDGGSAFLSGDDSPDRRIDVTAGAGGAPVYEYRVNGDVRPFDAAGRAWYEGMLLQVFRRAGLMAEERVASLLRSGGVGAVLQEIGVLTADHVFATYVQELLQQADLSESQAVQVVEDAAQRLDSDHYMSEVLQAVVARHLESNAVLAAFLDASRTVQSDHYRAGVLDIALRRTDLPPGHVAALLESASGIASDHYLAEVLRTMISRYALEPGVREGFLAAAESIESDHYRAEVLSNLIQRTELDAAGLAVALRSAEGIASDHYVTEVLHRIAQRDLSGELLDAYLDVAGGIESDHYRGDALKRLLVRTPIADAQLQGVIRSAAEMGSDHYKSDVLLDIVRRHRLEGATRETFMDAMSSIGSSHYRGQVADALLRRQPD
jgi:beta-lactamase regulating signal transducer with metallopeptidase domain